jgi:hypothetical protein
MVQPLVDFVVLLVLTLFSVLLLLQAVAVAVVTIRGRKMVAMVVRVVVLGH